MSARTARKATPARERHLRLIAAPPRPKRKRPKLSRIRRPRYEQRRTLHAYEERIVKECLAQIGREATVPDFEAAWPGRFNRRELWLTLVRMTTRGWPRDIQSSHRFGFVVWSKVKTSTPTTFWL